MSQILIKFQMLSSYSQWIALAFIPCCPFWHPLVSRKLDQSKYDAHLISCFIMAENVKKCINNYWKRTHPHSWSLNCVPYTLVWPSAHNLSSFYPFFLLIPCLAQCMCLCSWLLEWCSRLFPASLSQHKL